MLKNFGNYAREHGVDGCQFQKKDGARKVISIRMLPGRVDIIQKRPIYTKKTSLFSMPRSLRFFNISASEARSIDPQQRLLLECSYEALENSGVPKETIVGQNVGVFIGGSFSEYSLFCLRDTDRVPVYESTGTAQSVLANRLSYFFDLKGPSATVDTACSSGLSVLHLACQSLRLGESSQAIVGASHLNVMPDIFISMSNSRY